MPTNDDEMVPGNLTSALNHLKPMFVDQIVDNIYSPNPLFFQIRQHGGPALPPPIHGPFLPERDFDDLEVSVVVDHPTGELMLRFTCPGWESEPVYLFRDELGDLIDFLQAWRTDA